MANLCRVILQKARERRPPSYITTRTFCGQKQQFNNAMRSVQDAINSYKKTAYQSPSQKPPVSSDGNAS